LSDQRVYQPCGLLADAPPACAQMTNYLVAG
jgi:hypothetical protein